ncbi:MAG: quinone oxidoreductase [Hyphomicrobiales bacterium]|nr:quinone oxidoreductase [Hyphomicrobiales bacterium]
MKHILVREFGGPENMVVEQAADPEPAEGEVLVRHAFMGVNFADISQREGRSQGTGTQYETDLPYVPGNEASGIVEKTGSGVTGFKLGDRIAYRGIFGAYADMAIVPEESLVQVPDDIELRTAAALLTHGMTAHYVTHDAYPVAEGNWVLVHAAAGGTGGLVTQMAKFRGATVVATASSTEKLDHARDLGADHVIDYTKTDFEDACRAIPGFAGFHAVLDNVSAMTFERNLRLLRSLGTLVIFGASSGPIPPFDLQRLNALGSLAIRRTN